MSSEYRFQPSVLGALQGSQEHLQASLHESSAAPWRRQTRSPLGGATKRAIDIALALTTLVLLAPLLLIVAAALRIAIGRSIISKQKLVGFGGEVFTAYQFRTISDDGTIFTCLGTHDIEKLPLLFNILRGDMSFVGPLPLTSEERSRGLTHTRESFSARPGLIGLQHARGTRNLSRFKGAALDRHYVRHWSVGLDLLLLVKSVAAVRDTKA